MLRPPAQCFSSGFSRYQRAIDHVVTQYQVASGATVHAEGSWVMADGFGFNMSYTVSFETATADYSMVRGAESLRLFENGKAPRTVKCEGRDGYVGELQHIIEAIRSGQPPSIVTAQDGSERGGNLRSRGTFHQDRASRFSVTGRR